MSTRSRVEGNVAFALSLFRHAKQQGVTEVDDANNIELSNLIEGYRAAGGAIPDGDPLKRVRDAIAVIPIPMDDYTPQSYITGLLDVQEELDS
jgi:hypothetical protein